VAFIALCSTAQGLHALTMNN